MVILLMQSYETHLFQRKPNLTNVLSDSGYHQTVKYQQIHLRVNTIALVKKNLSLTELSS